MRSASHERPVYWIGSSKKDLLALPVHVRKFFGHAFHFAQQGDHHASAKPLKGFTGAGVLEVVEDDVGGTYRAVYTVKFVEAVFVLHCFQKKSKSGIATPQRHGHHPGATQGGRSLHQGLAQMKKSINEDFDVVDSSGNVFADLGLKDADKLKIKSGLAIEITKAVRRLELTQSEAANRMGISQPKVSSLLRGEFSNLSERKLMDCLNRLGYDIEIKIRPASAATGHLMLAVA